MVIGGGEIYPEIDVTLPPLLITKETMPEVIRNYFEHMQSAYVLENLADTVQSMPNDVDEFIERIIGKCEKLDPPKYDV